MTIEETTGEDLIGDTAKVPAEEDQPLLEDEEALETETASTAHNAAENTDGESVEKRNDEDEQNQKTFPQKVSSRKTREKEYPHHWLTPSL